MRPEQKDPLAELPSDDNRRPYDPEVATEQYQRGRAARKAEVTGQARSAIEAARNQATAKGLVDEQGRAVNPFPKIKRPASYIEGSQPVIFDDEAMRQANIEAAIAFEAEGGDAKYVDAEAIKESLQRAAHEEN